MICHEATFHCTRVFGAGAGGRRELCHLQRQLSLTAIFVTHDQEEANTASDRIAVIDNGIVQQVGSPMELYDRPANLFVANFLGVANVVPGTVKEADGGVLFRSDDGAVRVALGAANRAPSSIVFRPQNLIIRPVGAPAPPGMMRLAGTVDQAEFLGGIIRYRVTVGRHLLLVDAAHQRGEGAMEMGTPVNLFLNGDMVIGLAQ